MTSALDYKYPNELVTEFRVLTVAETLCLNLWAEASIPQFTGWFHPRVRRGQPSAIGIRVVPYCD